MFNAHCIVQFLLHYPLCCIVVLFSGGVSVTPLPGEEATISQPRGGEGCLNIGNVFNHCRLMFNHLQCFFTTN